MKVEENKDSSNLGSSPSGEGQRTLEIIPAIVFYNGESHFKLLMV